MTFEEKYFLRKRPDFEALIQYGFVKNSECYQYSELFRNDSFKAEITVNIHGIVSGRVFDLDAEEEYSAFRSEDRMGEFVGSIREAYSNILENISENCFIDVPFINDQSNRLSDKIFDTFGGKPDFPFPDIHGSGVFRHDNNRKWYALIMNISKDRLTGKKTDSDIFVDIVNLKAVTDNIPALTKERGIYPSYHMNKKYWISVILDGTLSDERIIELVHESYRLTQGNGNADRKNDKTAESKQWIVPSNPKYYDIEPDLVIGNEILWKQGKGIIKGDIVYLYVGAPVSAIRCRSIVTETDIPYEYHEDKLTIHYVMKIKILDVYGKDEYTFSKLKEHGIKAVRGPRFMPSGII